MFRCVQVAARRLAADTLIGNYDPIILVPAPSPTIDDTEFSGLGIEMRLKAVEILDL